MLIVRAQGSPAETIVYGIALLPSDAGVFVIDTNSGEITVGPNGTSRLVIQVNCCRAYNYRIHSNYSANLI